MGELGKQSYLFLYEYFESLNDDDFRDQLNDLYDKFNDLLARFNIKILMWPHSEICIDGKYILGTIVKRYNRIAVSCDKCKEYSCCNHCIGLTDNGWYDVSRICYHIVPISKSQICQYCSNDQKTVLFPKKVTDKKVADKTDKKVTDKTDKKVTDKKVADKKVADKKVTDKKVKNEYSKSCKYCHFEKLGKKKFNIGRYGLIEFPDERLKKWTDTLGRSHEYIYMLDDCLCCS